METTTLLTFVAVAGFVWGGFIVLLVLAVRGERAGEDEGDAEA
jgi:hypothetical protein